MDRMLVTRLQSVSPLIPYASLHVNRGQRFRFAVRHHIVDQFDDRIASFLLDCHCRGGGFCDATLLGHKLALHVWERLAPDCGVLVRKRCRVDAAPEQAR